jgi:hypothetical protein
METISRRRFVRMLAGVPFLGLPFPTFMRRPSATRLAVAKPMRSNSFCADSLTAVPFPASATRSETELRRWQKTPLGYE